MGKKTVGMPTLTNAHFMRGKKRIIYVGKSTHIMHGQTPRWECPHFFPHILCVGKNAHNIREKKRTLCMGKNTVGMPTHKMRILCVGKNAHNLRGKKYAYYARANPAVRMPTQKMRLLCMGKKAHKMRG